MYTYVYTMYALHVKTERPGGMHNQLVVMVSYLEMSRLPQVPSEMDGVLSVYVTYGVSTRPLRLTYFYIIMQ